MEEKIVKKKLLVSLFLSATFCFSVLGTACKEEEPVAISLNGVLLEKYSIVYDEEDVFSTYCAQGLSDLLFDLTGSTLTVVADTEAEREYEILVGKTDRAQSVAVQSVALQDDEYIVSGKNGKVALYGEGYMVGGAANHLVNELIRPIKRANKGKVVCGENTTPFTYTYKAPDSVIFMIGDGMGDNHIEWAKQEEVFSEFYPLLMPHQGKVTTYSYSVYEGGEKYTDSAAAATALATGYKTRNGMIGIDFSGESRKNIRELASEKGAKTAVLTTDLLTGATPAGFTAHCNDRGSASEIFGQIFTLLNENTLQVGEGALGNNLRRVTRETLNTISKNDGKYFIMIEEGYIDKNSHSNNKELMFQTLRRFNDTIAYAMQFTLMHPGTLLLVTADHETGGVTKEGNEFRFTSGDHTNADVSLFAMGKYAEELTEGGLCDNTDIPKFIANRVYGVAEFGGVPLK